MASTVLFGLWLACPVGAGCGSRAEPTSALPLAQLQDAGSAAPLSELSFAADAELWLEPRELIVRHPPLSGEGGERGRVQVVMRVRRHDGGVLQWLPSAADGSATGEGGRPIQLGGVAQSIQLAPARLGPLRASRVAALEIGVALLPREGDADEDRQATFVGAAAVERYPLAGTAEPAGAAAFARASELVASHGGTALLALQVPVIARPGAGSSSRRRLVAAARAGSVEVALTFDLRAEVEDHAPSAPAGD